MVEFGRNVGQTRQKPTGIARRMTQLPGSPNIDETASADATKAPKPVGEGMCWQTSGEVFWASHAVLEAVPAGVYSTVMTPVGPALVKHKLESDGIVSLSDAPSQQVIEEIREFWTLEDRFRRHDMVFKRGVLLHGPPGSGKTVTIQQLVRTIVDDYDGVAIMLDDPNVASQMLATIRRVEPHRPLIAMLEDLDALVGRYGESMYLSLLDGEAQVNGIVFVATTNYPENLDKRFVDRPCRFDCVREIGMPTIRARREYLQAKAPELSEAELDAWVARSAGLSIAHLRELIVLCCCYGKTLDVAVKRLESMRQNTPSSRNTDDGRRQRVGFVPGGPAEPTEEELEL